MTETRREQFQTLRGMRDVLSPESSARRGLVATFARQCELAGYREVVPPLVEDLGVFLRVGEATDVVTKEMYDFTDKDGTRIALRPEMTAGVVRAFVQHRPVLPWKVWYAGTNFRHERPQKGRYRMFDQVGVEVLGVDDPDLDVEVIALASRFFDSIGLYDDWGDTQRKRAGHWLRALGLGDYAKEKYDGLSFGLQRMALLARAMVKSPGILLLDEPTLGLDGHHRKLMLRAIDHIAANSDTQIIFVSHSAGETPACVNQFLSFEPRDDGFEVVCRETPPSTAGTQ